MSENTGWICPRCGLVHAPSVKRCDCTRPPFPCWPPKETTGTPIWVHEETDPFKKRPTFAPHYDFLVRPWLVRYEAGDTL